MKTTPSEDDESIDASSRVERIAFFTVLGVTAGGMIAMSWFAAAVLHHPLLGQHGGW